MTTAPPLIIAHQLGPRFAHVLPSLPPGAAWRELSPEQAWDVPDEAEILVAVPPRGGNIAVPDTAPAGWPRRLKWVQAVSAGVDEYPQWMFDVPVVTCGRGTNNVPIAEFVLAALLAVEKKLPEIWLSDAADWRRHELGTLQGKTLGLLGYGAIGQAIAPRAAAFGMKIRAFRRSAFTGPAPHGTSFGSLHEILAEADHLVIALPLTSATAGLIGRAALSRVKPGVHLVNISRGRILDHDALIEALDNKHVGFATLDVTEPEPLPAGHPLYTHPRVHLSPHVSWSGGANHHGFGALFSENLRRYLAGETLAGLVDPALGY